MEIWPKNLKSLERIQQEYGLSEINDAIYIACLMFDATVKGASDIQKADLRRLGELLENLRKGR